MPEIKVRNVNGKLVGIDENGNQVPLEFEDTVHDSVNADELNNAKWPDPADNVPGIRDAIDEDGVTVVLQEGRYLVEDGSFDPPRIPIAYNDVTVVMLAGAEIFVPDGITETDRGIRLFHVGGDDTTPQWNGTNGYDGFKLIGFGGVIDANYQNQGNISNQYDGHNIQIQGSDFQVRGIRSINATGDGVEPISRTTETVDGSTVPQSRNGTIIDCIFKDCFEQNIHFHGVKDVVVSGFIADGEVNNDNVNFFTHQTENDGVRLENGIIKNGQKQGIGLDEGSKKSRNIELSNLTVHSCDSNGIKMDSTACEDVEIHDVTVRDNRNRGVVLIGATDIEMSDITVKRNQAAGIFAESSNDIDGLKIRNPTVRNNNQGDVNARGIEVRALGGSISDMRIKGGSIVSTTSPLHQLCLRFFESSPTSYSNIYVSDVFMKGYSAGAPISNDFGATIKEIHGGVESRNEGVAVLSGDGTTTFTISHGLWDQPTFYNVNEANAEAGSAEIDYVTANDNALTVEFKSAPSSGTDNIELAWEARRNR